MSDGYFLNGAAESCPTIEADQELAPRCGPSRPIDAKKEVSAAPAPYSAIRRMLVDGIRKNPDKPPKLKHHAEVLIATIQNIRDEGENEDNRRAFHENYARLMQAAGHQ